ncbi:glycoside hydrolase family 3 C-terminal domain-containing protein [Tessaracoccus sp. MC1865]|uniref:glycoside hydrolase family 3 protein n=1 Tax=Tessaracoccus sp. MC1865 TaxID=2760310 RepID=UPI001603C8E6|nr:glycoside hydrolase family 3 C-terminal domain-containing protein [Tessaracoccus sp. MC1865]MBB1482426.1 glycoside hydrolase family 3 C-terminal domain-containing protein [Tessaracoccus sp. MC1865]QTO38116.1 glycoside hydrolase family 3 C-terminal domain-containing protein [Tessaracoccus sp. MC1865]
MTGSPWLSPDLALEDRVSALLADLAPADFEAVALGDFTALTSRGIPEPHYVDAGTGLRGVDSATAFPAGIALAASFDEELAEEYGAAVGEEARRAGFTVLLGPTVDLARDPVGGRIGEALGEDPHLTGVLGAAHVRGVQSRHVVAQVKHYVAYNGEKRRTGHGLEPERGDSVNVKVSRAELHDVYLRPFEAAIRAGAWSMMGSYNRLGGEYVCESRELLDLPREMWGWKGFYCPDFIFAVRDPQKALEAGLDLGALGGGGGRTPEMVAAADPGLLSRAVANVVRAMIGVGLVDHPLPPAGEPSSEDHRDLAFRAAVGGSVLLRNDGLLPLAAEQSVALIGPCHDDAVHVVGGAASVSLTRSRITSPRDAIASRAARVSLATGSVGDVPLPPVPASAFTLPDGSRPGVEVEFTDGSATWTDVLPQIDHTLDPADPGRAWPRAWRTLLTPSTSGAHRLSLTLGGAARVRLDGVEIMAGGREVEQFISGPHYPMQTVVDLRAGVPVVLEIDFTPGPAITIPPMGLGPTLRLGWQEPGDRLDEAARIAAEADVAVVFVTMATGEGMDRDSLAIPGDQNELVRRVAAANPRTVVVLNTPGAVEVDWADEVAAILQVWYPGERYGEALAAMLFGDAEPGGRLPLTFPWRRADLPGHTPPGLMPETVDYDEDGGIGYRSPGILSRGARFPFGFGLGYAATEARVSSGQLPDGSVHLDITVTNLGTRDTAHVAQVYARFDGEAARELVAFRRIPVHAGSTAQARITVHPTDLARWSDGAGRRIPVPGSHTLHVAAHSADEGIPVTVTLPSASC